MPKRISPDIAAGANPTPPSAAHNSTAPGAAEVELMRGIVDQTDRGLWLDLLNGTFRLAVRCDVCGRWLTSHKSKAAGRGASCAARVVR